MSAYANAEAEKTVITACMKDAMLKKHISELTPADFYEGYNQQIYMAMQALYVAKTPVTVPTLAEMITAQNDGNDAAMMHLLSLLTKQIPVNEVAVRESIRIIRDASKRRQARQLLSEQCKLLDDPANGLEAISEAITSKLRMVQDDVKDVQTLNDVLLAAYTELEERHKGKRKGMKCGVSRLDYLTAGFHRGEMTIIGARPAVGKSAFAAQIAIGVAREGYKVCVLSREMTDIQYGIRILSRHTTVKNENIRNGTLTDDEWTQVSDSLMAYSDCDIRFLFGTKYIEDLISQARKLKDNGQLDMLIIDYVQLMQSMQRFSEDYLRIAYISKALKDLSTELDIAVVALAQVGRSASGNMPTMAELRGSGDLEQDADNIIMIHRVASVADPLIKDDADLRDYYNAHIAGNMVASEQLLILSIAKQRQGQTGMMPVIFEPSCMRFSSLVFENME